MPAVLVSELHKSYGAYEALRGIDFEIEAGEVFGLLGPNGAGKTTTVEILEGYRRRDAGTVSVLDQDPQSAGLDWRQRIGVVLQSSAMYPNLTVIESLALFAGYYERPMDAERVVDLVGLGEKRTARVRTLSGGQKRRLDLGLGLVGDPEILFLDEPTTGFDPAARRAAWEVIRSLRSLGKTILLTTHYLDEAEQLSDRVAVLREGRIAAIGRPEELSGGSAADGDPLQAGRRGGGRLDPRADTRPARADRRGTRPGMRARRAERAETDARGGLPRADGGERGVKLFLHQLRGEQRLYWRSRELAFFTFLFPVLIFILLGSVYGNDRIKSEGNIKGSAYLLAGILGYGVASTAFAGLAIMLVVRREGGVLKRLRATPLPPAAYIVASLASTVIVFAIEVVALVVLARVLFGVGVPDQWVSLVLALLLGALAFAALGLALTGFIRSDEGSSAVVNAIYLPMSFLSGSFWSPHAYPRFLEVIADILPLTYFIRLMRDVVLRHETIWSNWQPVAVVAAWGVAGLIVAVRSFRWEPREG